MRRGWTVLLAALCLLSLTGCGARKEADENVRKVEGTYLKTTKEDMILIEGTGPVILEQLTAEMKNVLTGHKTGDVIRAEIDIIEESYPGHCYPKSVEFLREGSDREIDPEELTHLRGMGWYVITEDHPDGLPKFEFSLTWGVYGISSYDSATGKLVKTNDATRPEEYITEHKLTAEERVVVWEALMNLGYASLPKDFDPYDGLKSEPSETIVLKVTVEGEDYEIRCEEIAMSGAAKGSNEGMNFIKGIDRITGMLQGTEEWKALPDYEFIYE